MGLPGTSAVLRPGTTDLQPSEKTYLVEVVGETPVAAPIRVGGSVSYGQVLNELAPIRGLTVGVIGDSFTEGENGVPSYLGVTSVMCRELHADVIPSYQTGTGYLSPGQGGRAVFGDDGRIDAVLAGDPDVLFFGQRQGPRGRQRRGDRRRGRLSEGLEQASGYSHHRCRHPADRPAADVLRRLL